MADVKTLRFIKFGADFCGPCQSMKRAGTLAKLAAAHPEVEVEDVVLDYTEDGEEVENEKTTRAEKFDVQALPTFVITSMDESTVYADDSGAMNLAGLEKLLAKAMKKVAEAPKARPPTMHRRG